MAKSAAIALFVSAFALGSPSEAYGQLQNEYNNQNQEAAQCYNYFNQAQYDVGTGRVLIDTSNNVFRIVANQKLAALLMFAYGQGNLGDQAKVKDCEIIPLGAMNRVNNLQGGQSSFTIENGMLVEYHKGPKTNWQVQKFVAKPVKR